MCELLATVIHARRRVHEERRDVTSGCFVFLRVGLLKSLRRLWSLSRACLLRNALKSSLLRTCARTRRRGGRTLSCTRTRAPGRVDDALRRNSGRSLTTHLAFARHVGPSACCYRSPALNLKMNFAQHFIGGILKVVSNIDPAMFVPSAPPPPRRPLAFEEAHENDEEKSFRSSFKELAGDDMEVNPKELMDILNQVLSKHGKLKTDGFSIESCRSMVAVMDSDSTGKLGFHEFKYMWTNIKKWRGIYVSYDKDKSGVIGSGELSHAFKKAGFPLNDELYKMIIRRYSDEHGDMDFDNFVGCLVRLDAMCRAFKTLDKENSGSINLDIKEWLQLTMYS